MICRPSANAAGPNATSSNHGLSLAGNHSVPVVSPAISSTARKPAVNGTRRSRTSTSGRDRAGEAESDVTRARSGGRPRAGP